MSENGTESSEDCSQDDSLVSSPGSTNESSLNSDKNTLSGSKSEALRIAPYNYEPSSSDRIIRTAGY